METSTLSGELFASMLKGGADNLSNNREIVNELNVFPIPDGDTGDNMFMTIDSGFAAVSEASDTSSLDRISSCAARGMLLGARGNSGVILSRIFAGIARGFIGIDSADTAVLGKAFMNGVKEAYDAVSVPVEGTILTVYRDAVEYANSRIGENTTVEDYFDNFTYELRRSLERTPDLLAVLREAGVVDSGGAGFVYIAEGMKRALSGDTEPIRKSDPEPARRMPDLSRFNENSVFEFGYCTEFLLQLLNSKCDVDSFSEEELISYLNKVGNSVVAFRVGTTVKVHVHTDNPGEILNYCGQFGEFLTLKIENMTVQHSHVVIKDGFSAKPKKPHKKYATVTVASGRGIKETFLSLGTDVVVDGSQSMNPSAEDFIKAFDELDADTILVFPNNGNIIMTAKQAAGLYTKADVRVIPSKTIGEGYSAISMLDFSSGNTDEIISEAEEAIEGVVTGLVSKAVRDTEMDGVTVRKGDYIGFVGDKIYVDDTDRPGTATELADKLCAGDYGVVLLIYGSDVPKEEADELCGVLSAKYRKCEFITINGGQPVFDYIMVFE